MAIKETKREWNECQLGYTKEFLLNREEDVAELPECCTGSTAIVAESGNVYTVGKDKAWKKREEAMEEAANAPASSGGGGVVWVAVDGLNGHVISMYDPATGKVGDHLTEKQFIELFVNNRMFFDSTRFVFDADSRGDRYDIGTVIGYAHSDSNLVIMTAGNGLNATETVTAVFAEE